MVRNQALTVGGFVLGLALFTANLSWAADPSAGPPSGAPAQSTLKPAAEPESVLGATSGRGDSTTINTVNNNVSAMTEQDLNAVNSGNTITAGVVGSGPINLQGNALSGFSGVGNILLNTGHNNNLQSTMSVTIVIAP